MGRSLEKQTETTEGKVRLIKKNFHLLYGLAKIGLYLETLSWVLRVKEKEKTGVYLQRKLC